MQAHSNQLSFADVYSDIDEYFQQDKPKLIELFEQYIDLSKLIPQSFYNHYYASTGHPRDYKLSSMLTAMLALRCLRRLKLMMLLSCLISTDITVIQSKQPLSLMVSV